MIHLIPLGGLCNRMRAIDSAIAISEKFEISIQINWIKDSEMTSSFNDLFESIETNNISINVLNKTPFLYRQSRKKNLFLPGFIRGLLRYSFFDQDENEKLKKVNFMSWNTSSRIVIRSYGRFFAHKKLYKDFKPLSSLRNNIVTRVSKFNDNTIGVHIRRTDNVQSIMKSPIDHFELHIDDEIKKNPKANFYLASDSEKIKKYFTKKYNNRIIIANEKVDRKTIVGEQNAVVELYSLANTKKILGSYFSSFSHTAAEINGIEEITVMK